MVNYFSFYKPLFNPTGMSGTVGGIITSTELLPRKDTLFCPRETSNFVTVDQYRKMWIKQVYSATMTGITIELVNVDQSGQISFGISTGTNDTSTSPSTAPSGVFFTGTYNNPITLTGTTQIGTEIPVWIKQSIPPGSEDDDFVSFQIRITSTII